MSHVAFAMSRLEMSSDVQQHVSVMRLSLALPSAGFRQAERLCIDGDCTQAPGTLMSQAGRQQAGRRLFIGSGIGGMGVQCAVDVGFIVDNIYDSIFFIQQATNLDFCSKNVRYGPYNYLTGVPEAACAMDIAGAIAWITQIATFVEQLVSHCPDLLNLPTLCGSSATGMFSAASQIASWGSGIAVSCGSGESLTRVPATIVLANYSDIAGSLEPLVKALFGGPSTFCRKHVANKTSRSVAKLS